MGLGATDSTRLLTSVLGGACTPFIGAGTSSPPVLKASQVAAQWAQAYAYRMPDWNDLTAVATWLALKNGSEFPKRLMCDLISLQRVA